jgi:hypothetical protein
MMLTSALRPLLELFVNRTLREKRLKRQRLMKLLSEAGRSSARRKAAYNFSARLPL